MKGSFDGVFEMPAQDRSVKPRSTGFTMVLDKGLGPNQTQDLVDMAGHVVDDVKLTFGTSAFYSGDMLRKKIDILKAGGVDVMPGGTFLEVSVWQGKYKEFLARCKEMGFTWIEVSDGTINIDAQTRADCIKRGLDEGFKVISEVGQKDPTKAKPVEEWQKEISADLEAGSFKVIVEAREAGKGVGIFDSSGGVKDSEVDQIIAGVDDTDKLVWEAPIKAQYQYLIMRFGTNVNLGNIPPDDVLALEALRCGLRGDTLAKAYEQNPEWK